MATSPMFWSIETIVAWVVLQFKVDDCPDSIAAGSAENITLGSGADAVTGADGAGGAITALFLQPGVIINVENARVSRARFEMGLFIDKSSNSQKTH